MAVNIGLNLWLIPEHGIVGAGIALVASYLVVIVLMGALRQRLFPVPYQWAKLAGIVAIAAAVIVGGELLLPTDGADGFLLRGLLWAAFPLLLWFARIANAEEKAALRRLPALLSAARRPPEPPSVPESGL